MNSMNSKRPRWPQTPERLPGRGGEDQYPDLIVLVGVVHYLQAYDKSHHFKASLGAGVKPLTKGQWICLTNPTI